MPDYGRGLGFGVFPTPEAGKLDEVLTLARVADQEGLEYVGIQDHPYQRRFLDTWMLMATVLARTERVRVFPDVANLPLRPPAVTAKAAASLDVLSDGRFELGLGAGAFWEAVEAMGGARRSPKEAVDALVEAIEVIRLMWSDQPSVRFDGHHYRLAGVKPGPPPVHPIGIWLGVGGPRTLALVGRTADGWVPSSGWATPDKLPDMHARIDEAAVAAGRDPSGIARIYNVWGKIDGTGGFLQGGVAQWVDELTELSVEHGMDTFVFGPSEDPVRQLQRFAAEVAPAVRERVARHRGGAASG
ncbi:MAG TPA: LLM class flavin-dependent oxidoreductase [Nocardioides sp.]|uniref:LLM class flavin-dependent oxidoreductase n=1 Tax=Nocardioides sp. TaxID=35761 RepID=UPI002D7FAE40|nr:LLM class flavin-dependent oxidoreductase [Nocardioides sp.]HET6652493.1 LLM class flavin-dependent oxidoreductase [Nocardioides sp.]